MKTSGTLNADKRKRISLVLQEHDPFGLDVEMDPVGNCGCGLQVHYESWFTHAADAVYAELTRPLGEQVSSFLKDQRVRIIGGRHYRGRTGVITAVHAERAEVEVALDLQHMSARPKTVVAAFADVKALEGGER